MAYPIGEYVCKIVAQGFSESKEKKTPFFFFDVEPIAQINPADPEGPRLSCDKYIRTVSMYLTKNTVERVIAQLRELGWTGDNFKEIEPNGGFSFVGVEVLLNCTHDESDGKVYDRFEFPFGGGEKTEATPGIGRTMDALYGAALKDGKGKDKKPESEPQRETVPADNDIPPNDDVPF